MASRNEILHEVESACERADGKWGGASSDDALTANEWHDLVADYNGWARRMATMGSPDKARKRLVQLAGIAVAAVEAIDRKSNSEVR
jgi:hypothetical protein